MKTKVMFTLALLALAPGCAHEQKVLTFKEAMSDSPNLESGVYNRTNGENVQVTVTSLKAANEELQKKVADLQHELDYYKRTNDEMKFENMALRVRGNVALTKEVVDVKGFDHNHDPILEKKTVEVVPASK